MGDDYLSRLSGSTVLSNTVQACLSFLSSRILLLAHVICTFFLFLMLYLSDVLPASLT